MSSTRHADDDSPLNQERYMSSPEYAELRGVNGIAATAKASLNVSARKRSLLFFLQSLSLEKGGLREQVAKPLLKMFPDRVGPDYAQAWGLRAGQKLSDEQLRKVLRLRDDNTQEFSASCLLGPDEMRRHELLDASEIPVRLSDYSRDADYYLAQWGDVDGLTSSLVDLCINPTVLITDGENDHDDIAREIEVRNALEHHRGLREWEIKGMVAPNFRDLCGALFEFQRRHNAAASESFAKTTVARRVHQTLDACLASRKMVLIEGESDAGKSTSGEAWCAMHKGEARFVRLQGITNKTVFFRALSKSLGIASSYSRTSTEMEARVADMLQRSGLMLVLDESQYTFVQGERIRSRPELVDWIQTALLNHGVPVALIASPLFSKRLHQAERHTIWNSDQWRRRIYRHVVLPVIPTRDDIELVVKHHLPGVDAASLKYLAGYASTCIITRKEPRTKKEQKVSFAFTAITDTLADAIQIANAAGRTRITLQDLKEAVATFRSASELEKRRAFDSPQKAGTKRAAKSLQPSCSEVAGEPQPQAQEREKDFTGRNRPVAALEMPGTRETAPALSDA